MRMTVPAIALLLLAGFLYRLWPAWAGQPDLSTFFLTEDGYLLLTVARNLGLGNGMTVSDGLIATNGIQPLITFLFTVPYWTTGGDKVTSLVWVHVIHAIIALGAAFAIRALASRLLSPHDPRALWPWAIALVWFLGPVPLRHSMNGLETGLATLMIAATLVLLHKRIEMGASAGRGMDLALGAMCGLTILSRIDAGVFAVLVFAIWAAVVWTAEGGLRPVLSRLVPAGIVTTLIAAPWFLRNLMVFGALMPISGDAQKLGAIPGENLPLLPSKLFETAFPMLPVPARIETLAAVQFGCLAAIALIVLLFVWRLSRNGSRAGVLTAGAGLLYAGFLSYYYGTQFGAGHFLSRYLAPVSPILIIAAVAACLEAGRRLPKARTLLAGLYAWGGIAVSVALLALLLGPLRFPQGHEATIGWVRDNVPETLWVGAPQTGTLGYWHDRTINLDGKVNPDALAARRETRLLDYVVTSPITYIVDWAGVGNWVTFEEAQGPGGFAETFELILQDEDRNLSVMARRAR